MPWPQGTLISAAVKSLRQSPPGLVERARGRVNQSAEGSGSDDRRPCGVWAAPQLLLRDRRGSPWNILSKGASLSIFCFRRIPLAALESRKHLWTLKSEDDYNISREVMVAEARDGCSGKRLTSDCFEGRTC